MVRNVLGWALVCLSWGVAAGTPGAQPQPAADEAAVAENQDQTHAQRPASLDAAQPSTLEEMVVTASGEQQAKWEVPVSVGRVDRAALRAKNPTHAADVMGDVPGVWVNVTGGEGHMTAIRQPLTTAPLYLYLENGVPTRSTGFFNHNALYEINLPMAESVEVIKGPGSALHGSDAIGGVVNVATRRAPLHRDTEVNLQGGENGYGKLLFSTGDTVSGHGYLVDLNHTKTDGWRDGTAYTRDAGNLTWEHITPRGQVRAMLAFTTIDQDTAGSSAISEADYRDNPTVNYTPISLRNVDALRLSVAYDRLVGEHGMLSITPFVRDNRMELLPNWSLSYDPTLYETANTSYGVNARYRMDLAPLRTRLIFGVEADHSPGGQEEYRLDVVREGGIYTAYTRADKVYDYDVTFNGLSGFVQAAFSPVDALRITTGLRYDHMGYAYTTHLPEVQEGNWRVPGSTDVSYEQFSPKLGVSWRPTETFNVFGSYRHAFRAPSQGQLFRQGSSDDTLGLEAVKARNLDLGVRGRLGGRLTAELTAYRLVKTDDILSYIHPVTGFRESVNAGETLHRGLELGLTLALTERLGARLSASEAKHTYEAWLLSTGTDYSGNEMEAAPRTIGRLALDYRPAVLGGGAVSLEWQRLGAYWMDPANTERYAGHDLLGLRAAWQLNDAFSLQTSVDNLADTRYAERASYNRFRGREFAPGMPRTAYLNLRYRWR